jgi:aspartate racemase
MSEFYERDALELLRPEEQEVPDAVLQTARFLARRDIWFRLSRNREARSCRDAARKRQRLGHVGIPLRDEMKSYFGRASAGDALTYVMAHCRGDQEIDLEALAAAIGSSDAPARLTHDELRSFGLEYGLVNPFEHWDAFELDGRFLHAPVLQVFDEDLLRPLGTPGTVMTNAGDATWGVELHAEELFNGLSASADHRPPPLRVNIARPTPGVAPRPPHLHGRRSIAIITGNAPESGIALWEATNGQVRALLGDDNSGDASMPPVRVLSLPELGMTMELDRRAEDVWSRLAPAVAELCAADTALLAIACNTTQYFVERIRAICEPAGVTFVCLPEIVAAWLQDRRVREVAVVGIPYVAHLSAGWSAYAAPLKGFEVEDLQPATLDRLVELAYRVKEEGPTQGGLNQLRSILNDGVHSSHVVLALTELSVLLALQRKAGRSGKTIIDPLGLYAEALARRWLGLTFPPQPAGWSVQLTGLTHHGRRVDKDDPTRARNEDAVLLASRVLHAEATAADEPPRVHQELRDLGREDRGRASLIVAVADGVGSHAAAAHASQLVVRRLRDASGRLHDPDRVEAVLADASSALALEAAHEGDPPDACRSATVAGLALAIVPGGNADLEVVWFSVGDCLLLVIEEGSGLVGAGPRLLCEPAVSPDGHPQRALGANAVALADTGLLRLSKKAVFLCLTDGFAESFNAGPGARGLVESLSEHEALRPIWQRIVENQDNPDVDRAIAQDLFAAAQRLWPPTETSRRLPDNLSLVLVRVSRDAAALPADNLDGSGELPLPHAEAPDRVVSQ